MPDCVLPRFKHSAEAIELAPGLIEVTFFGGSPRIDFMKSPGDQPKLAETVVTTFGTVASCQPLLCTVCSGACSSLKRAIASLFACLLPIRHYRSLSVAVVHCMM